MKLQPRGMQSGRYYSLSGGGRSSCLLVSIRLGEHEKKIREDDVMLYYKEAVNAVDVRWELLFKMAREMA